jgi:hypothetical protein
MWTRRQGSAPSPKRKPERKAGLGCSALLKLRKLGCSPRRPRNARDPDRDRPLGSIGRMRHAGPERIPTV